MQPPNQSPQNFDELNDIGLSVSITQLKNIICDIPCKSVKSGIMQPDLHLRGQSYGKASFAQKNVALNKRQRLS
jgi:hypothetical protein